MSLYVIDAGIAAKWFLTETDFDFVILLRALTHTSTQSSDQPLSPTARVSSRPAAPQ